MMPIKPKKIKFKMPKETPTERAHRLHQEIRKKSGLPDPEEYRRRAAEKQREIDAIKEAETFKVGHDGQSIKRTADSQRKAAESRAKAMGTAAANRSKMAALKDVIKEPQRDVKEGIEMELEEAIKLGSKVQIHAPGKSYHGKTGHVGEIRNGAFKGAPKTYTVDHGDGSVQVSQKNVKLHKEDVDIDESAWGQNKMANLKAAHDRHSEKAIAANKAGDHEAVKVHQRKMGMIKTQMNKLRTEDVEQVDEISAILAGNYLDKVKAKHGTNYNDLPKKRQRGVVNALDIKMNAADKKMKEEVEIDESIKDHIEQSMAAKDINAKVEGDKVHVHPENLNKARSMLDKMGLKHSVHGTLKDSVEYCHWEIITEGWKLGNRNPQKGVKIGDKVRSYDFPGMHDDHYVEGHVVRETPSSYHLRVNKVVRAGKEIPVPAHMNHVEAPKGKGLFSDAYGVHKIMAKQQSVSAVQEPIKGGQKTFKDVRGK